MACGQQIVIKRPNHQHIHTDITDFDFSVTSIINQTILNSASANWNSTFNTVCSMSGDWMTGGGTYTDRLSSGEYQAILDINGQLIIPYQLSFGAEDSYIRIDNPFGLIVGGEGRNILLRPIGSEGNEFIFGTDNTLTFPDGSIQSTAFTNNFVHLSGGIMTGGLSAPSLSCNTFYVGASTIYFVDNFGTIINSLKFSDVEHLNSVYSTTSSSSAIWSRFSSVSGNIILNGGNLGITEIGSLDNAANLIAGGEAFIQLNPLDGNIYIFDKALVPYGGTLAVYGTLTSTNFITNSISSDNIIIGTREIASTDVEQWQSTYSTVNTTSANWNYQGTDIKLLSSGWQNTLNTVYSNSAQWATDADNSAVNTFVLTNSANITSSYTTVNSNSANWNYQGTDIKSLTANWQSTYNTTNNTSANWDMAVYGYVAGQANSITNAGYGGTRAIVGGFDNDIRVSDEGSQTIIGGNTNTIYSGANNCIIDSQESSIRSSSHSFILGGFGNSLSGAYMSGILGGEANVNKKNNSFVIGSNITAPSDNFTLVNNLSSENIIVANSANFVTMKFTNTVNPDWEEGRIFYDTANHTLAYYNDNSQVTVNVGQEQLVRVYNDTGATITNGQVVYLTGSHGNVPMVYLANAAYANLNTHKILGIATSDIPSTGNKTGYVTTAGTVHSINVGSTVYTEGDNIFLDTVDGMFTNIPPSRPNHVVDLGIVVGTSGGGSNRSIDVFVKVVNTSNIEELCNVVIANSANGDVLLYNTLSGGYWYNYSSNNWQNTFTTFATQSANNISVYTTYQANSASSSSNITGRQQIAFAWL